MFPPTLNGYVLNVGPKAFFFLYYGRELIFLSLCNRCLGILAVAVQSACTLGRKFALFLKKVLTLVVGNIATKGRRREISLLG